MTANELKALILENAGRGVFSQTGFFRVEVFVPFWKIATMRAALRDKGHFAVLFPVKPLSLLHHFTIWDVREAP